MPALCIEEGFHEPVSTVSCVPSAPLLKRMKVLKKLKRRMGLGGRNGSECCQHPPLSFHQVCGDNVRIDSNGRVARRIESFCKGISFSSRPVKVGERVCIRLLEISTNWSGVIRFGFTSQDPTGLRDALPKYACPDLTSKPGYWAKALSERFAEQGLVLYYYFTATGDVHFGINGEERGLFFSGVETRCPLWALIDVYGNSTAVEMLDPLAQLNNRVRIVNDLRPGSTAAHSRVLAHSSSLPSTTTTFSIQDRPLPQPAPVTPPAIVHPPQQEIDCLQSSVAQLTLARSSRYFHSASFTHLPFHRVKGRNVVFSSDRMVVSRQHGEYAHGYVFTGRPLIPGEKFVIQILETESIFVGAIAFGLTAANPAGLEDSDLPDDCDLLLDRPEYWVVSKDVASSPCPGDELAFVLTTYGAVTFSKNGGPPQTLMHVDHTLQLWAFFDVYGNTKKIRCLGVTRDSPTNPASVSRPSPSPESQVNVSPPQVRQIAPASLVVNLPPSPPDRATMGGDRPISQRVSEGINTLASVCSSTYMDPVSRTGTLSSQCGGTVLGNQHECTVCYEKSIDSVLYMCGHMCMCYECALQQWRGRGGGHCPICRAPIRDVIRTYKA